MFVDILLIIDLPDGGAEHFASTVREIKTRYVYLLYIFDDVGQYRLTFDDYCMWIFIYSYSR